MFLGGWTFSYGRGTPVQVDTDLCVLPKTCLNSFGGRQPVYNLDETSLSLSLSLSLALSRARSLSCPRARSLSLTQTPSTGGYGLVRAAQDVLEFVRGATAGVQPRRDLCDARGVVGRHSPGP